MVIRANGHHHQDATMSPELQIGCVTGGGWMGTQQHLWMELYSYSQAVWASERKSTGLDTVDHWPASLDIL